MLKMCPQGTHTQGHEHHLVGGIEVKRRDRETALEYTAASLGSDAQTKS